MSVFVKKLQKKFGVKAYREEHEYYEALDAAEKAITSLQKVIEKYAEELGNMETVNPDKAFKVLKNVSEELDSLRGSYSL